MSKELSSFLQDCFLKRNTAPQPGDEMDFNTFEKVRGKASMVEAIRSAIAGEVEEDGSLKRIDEPLRNITIRIFYFLTHIGNYYSGLFTPKSKDKQFIRDLQEV